MTPFYIGGGVILGVAVIFAGWGLASRRQSLPCPVWLRWMVELDNPFTRTNRATVIIEHLDVRSGMTILDAGCGPGRLAVPLGKAVGPNGKVVAMDLQEGMIRRAQEKATAAGLENMEYLNAGLGEGKLGSNRFDRALLVTVLGEIPDRDKALREIHDSLKPGGILSITEVIFDPHFHRQRTVKELAGKAGFREKAIFGNGIAYTAHFQKPLSP